MVPFLVPFCFFLTFFVTVWSLLPCFFAATEGYFSIQIFHGGKFVHTPRLRYEGGSSVYVDDCHEDKISLLDIADLVEKLGYVGMINYYYVMTRKTLKKGLKMLFSDADVLDMIAQLPPSKVVDLYIEPINPIDILQTQQSSYHGMGSTSEAGVEPAMLEDVIELGEEHIDGGDEYMHLGSNSGSSSESDVSFYEDSEYEQSDDDGLYEANIDEAVEWGGFHNRKEKQPVELELGEGLDDSDDLGDVSSDELQSVHSNSDEDGKTRYPEYRRETDLGKVTFKTGMLFCTAKEFKTEWLL